MRTLTRQTTALVVLMMMMPSCLNHNLYREMRLKRGSLLDVVTALQKSGKFISVEDMGLKTEEVYFAYFRPEYQIHYLGDTNILGFQVSLKIDEEGRYLRLMARTHIGMTCSEIPVAVEFLRDCHALLIEQGIDLESISPGQSFIDNEIEVLEGQPASVMEK